MSDEQEKRKKALFEALDEAEKTFNRNQSESSPNIDNFNSNRRHQRHKIDKYKNKNSIFKRPTLPIRKCLLPRGRACHELHPEKYTKYSLSDVIDLNDNQNKAAAYNFLREMEQRKLSKDDNSEQDPGKIIFRNSAKLKDEDNEEKNRDIRIKGQKFVMEEYVVGLGEKKKSKSEKKATSMDMKAPKSQLKLSHLDEEDE
jgi:hypothetical protein